MSARMKWTEEDREVLRSVFAQEHASKSDCYEAAAGLLGRPVDAVRAYSKWLGLSATQMPRRKPGSRAKSPGDVLARLLARGLPAPATGCLLWTGTTDGVGYGQVSLQGRKHGVHRLRWELAHGPIPDGMFICHSCDVPLCFNIEHLFLGTPKDNVQDMKSKGRIVKPHGEQHFKAKLTDEAVRAIRRDHADGTISTRALAARYGVSPTSVRQVLSRKTWHHVQA